MDISLADDMKTLQKTVNTQESAVDNQMSAQQISDHTTSSDQGQIKHRGVYIKTYGCQMNVYDSQRMIDILRPLGYRPVGSPDGADLVIVNTCHIREKASEKMFSELGRLHQAQTMKQQAGSRMMLAVAGCVAQAQGSEILRRAPFVDMVFGPQTYHKLPEMVAQVTRSVGGVLETDFAPEDKFDTIRTATDDLRDKNCQPDMSEGTVSAFLTIQEGCDKFCTFCVVPYTRGAEYSRPVSDVLAEARALVRRGVRDITLLGQNVNAYHGDRGDGSTWSLARLMLEMADIEGLLRLRYTTSHPCDMSDDLIKAHATCPVVMPYLHLPVQSGSDRILAAMNRRHTRDSYCRIIDRLRTARPDIALSGDFIVGFPGETDQDFSETLSLVRHITYAQAYSFKYSPRPGTPAATLPDQGHADAVSDRLYELQALLSAQQHAFNQGTVGHMIPVLLERKGRYDGQLVGRTPYMQALHVQAPSADLGALHTVKVTGIKSHSLEGDLVRGTSPAYSASPPLLSDSVIHTSSSDRVTSPS